MSQYHCTAAVKTKAIESRTGDTNELRHILTFPYVCMLRAEIAHFAVMQSFLGTDPLVCEWLGKKPFKKGSE